VEVLATGVSNLMEDKTLRSSAILNAGVVIAVAVVLGLAAASTSFLAVPSLAIGALATVLALAYYLFGSANIAMPIIIPTAVELPVGALAAAFSITSAERKLRRTIESAARQFLPGEIAERVRHGMPARLEATSKKRSGIFLATDMEGFTTTAERLSPEALSKLVAEYFEPLFQAVLSSGGEVLDVTGDSMMCVWYSDQLQLQSRRDAVRATLEMAEVVARFGLRHPSSPLRTRFALHTGTVALGVVGASGRYVATVVGDVKNAVSRIDSLNKMLRTCVLASREAVVGVEGVALRPLGRFAVVGKSESLDLAEILGGNGENPQFVPLSRDFAHALAAFDSGDWGEAVERFRDLAATYPEDGPTAYFLDLAKEYVRNSPSGGARPIRVNLK
jgi:adenylate cyclase